MAEVAIVGVHGGQWFGADAAAALGSANIIVGAPRHLTALPPGCPARLVSLSGPVGDMLDQVAAWRDDGEKVAVLASGDPGFFGLLRLAASRLGSASISVHPAPSAPALAFARTGLSWDDAVVVSAHGRPPEAAVDAVGRHPKVAVLVSPEFPPEELGRRLQSRWGPIERNVVVASQLGSQEEVVWRGDVAGLASGVFDPVSVVVLAAPEDVDATSDAGLMWGRADDEYVHRDGMITKAEVRAVALGKLRLPAAGIVWDVGAGSGSVAAECARLRPGLRIYAVERSVEAVADLHVNVAGTGVTVIRGEAPAVLDGLPDPDRAFVGGGGIEVLDAVLARLRPSGVAVATYASLERAAHAADRLGHLVQVAVSRGTQIGPDGSWRLAAANPVFVCWGPQQ